ncbi:cytochrome-c peroxidase [Roseinatronobacter alkalisoli]|uniref:Cytochrome c peroxidase n=1 Tax=Roseinatronobacter alkalisoli TaxID=3028235 RepID=A0ABT5TAQ9_9RHOB|nr:cytochrome c peroxidase [Roseinatronobacter sp. HJB301]MDD7972205.1 cytochrome c peroxidase [Roseinatronobacter sp. HJB301]
MRCIALGLIVVAGLAPGGAMADIPLPDPVSDTDYASHPPELVRLGWHLFYDPILSGNREVACATCHHPAFGTSDGVSLGLGDGGRGLGPARVADADNMPEQRIPRNSPALWNLGAHEFTRMFHDGRIEEDPTRETGLRTPLEGDMMVGFASLLSAQNMFPVLSPDEMAGHYSENEIAQAVRQGRITGAGGAWDLIAARVRGIPDYAARFIATHDNIGAPDDIAFTDISNAIAAFVAVEFRSDTSPFDAFLRDGTSLPEDAARGMGLFYGRATCSTCHSGPFQTDHGFHARGVPQLGPGKAARFESHRRDTGRMRVTGRDEDAFAFRTPSLRNVAHSAPYGHAGSHATLAGFIRDHADPVTALTRYDRAQVILPDLGVDDWLIMNDPVEIAAIAGAVQTPPIALNDDDIADIVAFLNSLSDPQALAGQLGVPPSVPSGLVVPNP